MQSDQLGLPVESNCLRVMSAGRVALFPDRIETFPDIETILSDDRGVSNCNYDVFISIHRLFTMITSVNHRDSAKYSLHYYAGGDDTVAGKFNAVNLSLPDIVIPGALRLRPCGYLTSSPRAPRNRAFAKFWPRRSSRLSFEASGPRPAARCAPGRDGRWLERGCGSADWDDGR